MAGGGGYRAWWRVHSPPLPLRTYTYLLDGVNHQTIRSQETGHVLHNRGGLRTATERNHLSVVHHDKLLAVVKQTTSEMEKAVSRDTVENRERKRNIAPD
jgi:hypothetical protein